ncbi:MAG: hypothetical protein ACMV0I_07690 [Pseudomonas sp.]
MKPMTELEICSLEKGIPELACRAIENAYKKALKAGSNVLEVIGNQLVETSPDGSQKVLKELPKAREFKVGTKFRIG